jgi:hypothetical protein
VKWIALLALLPFVFISGRLTAAPASLGGPRLASAASIHTWRKVAVAAGDSNAYANAGLKATERSYGGRLTVRATSRANVSGEVDCTRGLDNQNRAFSLRVLRGRKRIPTPLVGGQCRYSVSAELPRGGKVELALYVLR